MPTANGVLCLCREGFIQHKMPMFVHKSSNLLAHFAKKCYLCIEIEFKLNSKV